MAIDQDDAGHWSLELAGEVEEEELAGEENAQCPATLGSEAQEEPLKPAPPPQKKAPGKKRPPPAIRINLANCRYNVLRNVQRKLGWKEVGDEEDWEVYWTDTSVGIERIVRLSKTQKINHFNGMLELCRKKSMARNLSKMLKLFPEHYDFMPRTFSLPLDMQELMNDVRARGKKQIYILKPDAGSQGKGIRLVQGGKEEAMAKAIREMDLPNAVAQHYLAKPLLVNGFKFDMRIYALVLSCDPLRLFIYKEGLTRICTEKYVRPKGDNLNLTYMHLTNYAVNKHNESFLAGNTAQAEAEAAASKWTLAQLAAYLKKQGYEWQCIWERIQHLIVKSLISVQPIIRNNYRSILPPDNDGFSCFEILGFDIMLDSELRPWLLEVNHSPSFSVDSPLDLAIKEQLIMDTFDLARIDPKLIAKAKKAERKATAGRLLEPLHKRKPASAAPSNTPSSSAAPTASTNGSGLATAAQSSQPSEEGPSTKDAPASAGIQSAGVASKLRTPEEYEALKQEMLAKREKYEAKHMGAYERIFPSPNQELQELYEKLLKGATELFQSSFQAKAKRALESLGEERRRKEECESDSVKAEKARARAHRDRLAQMAMERRAKKAEEKAEAEALAAMQVMPPGNSLHPSETAAHAVYYPATVTFPAPQQPMHPLSQYPAASAGWGLLGANMGWAGYAGAVDEGSKGASGLSLLNRLGSYGGGGASVQTHELDDAYAVGMQLPTHGSNGIGGPIPCPADCALGGSMSAHPNNLQGCESQGVTTSSALGPNSDHPSLRLQSSPSQQWQQQHHHHQLHHAEPAVESYAALSSQPIRSLVRKSMENSSPAEAHVPPLNFGPQFPPHYHQLNCAEAPRPLSRSSTSENDTCSASRARTPPPATHGATTCSLQGLSLQPGGLSTASSSYHAARRALPPQVPQGPHSHTQPALPSPSAAATAAAGASGRSGSAQTGSERPYVPSLRSSLSGWGNQERTLPASFLSPRSQAAAVRPGSNYLHSRPGSVSVGEDAGQNPLLPRTPPGGHHEGSPSLIGKLAPSGLSSPPHPIYSSANPALMSASPASLVGGIVGSPAKPSSAQRSRRTLSAPHKESGRHAEGMQASLQRQQQQALEHRLQQLQQQQQQQQQQQEEHSRHAPPVTAPEQPASSADRELSAPPGVSPPVLSTQHMGAAGPRAAAAITATPGGPGQQQQHCTPSHDQRHCTHTSRPEAAAPSAAHLHSSRSAPVPATAAATAVAGALRPEHPGSCQGPVASGGTESPLPPDTNQFNSVTGPLVLGSPPLPASCPAPTLACPPTPATTLAPHAHSAASQAVPRQHPHLPLRPSSVPPRSSSASPLVPSTSLRGAITTPHASVPSSSTSLAPSHSLGPQQLEQEHPSAHTPKPPLPSPPVQQHHHHTPSSVLCDAAPGSGMASPAAHSLHDPSPLCRPSSSDAAQHQHHRHAAAAKPPVQGVSTSLITGSTHSTSPSGTSLLRRNSRRSTQPTASVCSSAPVHMLYSLGGSHKEAQACASPALVSAPSSSRRNLQESTRMSKQLVPGRSARSTTLEAQQGAGQSNSLSAGAAAGSAACGGLRGGRNSAHACGVPIKGVTGSTKSGSADEVGSVAAGGVGLLSVMGDSPLLSVMGYKAGV